MENSTNDNYIEIKSVANRDANTNCDQLKESEST